MHAYVAFACSIIWASFIFIFILVYFYLRVFQNPLLLFELLLVFLIRKKFCLSIMINLSISPHCLRFTLLKANCSFLSSLLCSSYLSCCLLLLMQGCMVTCSVWRSSITKRTVHWYRWLIWIKPSLVRYSLKMFSWYRLL